MSSPTATQGPATPPPPRQPTRLRGQILVGVLGVLWAVGSLASVRMGVASYRYRQLTASIYEQLAAGMVVQDKGLPGRVDPATLPGILVDRSYALDWRADGVEGETDAGDFTPQFAHRIDLALARFARRLPEAARMRAVYLAERGRYALSPDKRALRSGVALLLVQVGRRPLDALAQFELALAADALADLEDDRPGEIRLARAARLRSLAGQSMRRAVDLAAAASSYDVGFLSNVYVCLVGGSYFAALHRHALAEGDEDAAAANLEVAMRAFRNALVQDSGQHHVELAISSLRDESAASGDRHAVGWEQIGETFRGTHPNARLVGAQRIMGGASGEDQQVRLRVAEELIRGLLADPSVVAGQRDGAHMALLSHSLVRGDLEAATAQVTELVSTSRSRDRALLRAMALYRAHHQMPMFYEVVSQLQRTPGTEFPMLEFACGEAAFATQDLEGALQHFKAFVADPQRLSSAGDELQRARLRLAQINWQLGHPSIALTYYRTLWASDPSSHTVAVGYARALLESGNRNEARAHIVEILDRWPGDEIIEGLSRQLEGE